MSDIEIWKPILGWEGVYEVSSHGRVKRVAPGQGARVGKILKAALCEGYPKVGLKFGGRNDKRFVHSLVAEAFHGPRPSPRHDVAHNDGDRENPKAKNLRWATRAENCADTRQHGRFAFGEAVNGAKLTEDAVRYIRANKDISYTALGKQFSVSAAAVRLASLGLNWGHVRG